MGVLGTIFMGIASPTESASVGAAGSIACAAINRRLNWPMIKDACYSTLKVSAMALWIIIAAFSFKAVFIGVGGPQLASDFASGLDVPPIAIILFMQLSYMFLGCFLEEVTIIMITMPVYLPIVTGLGFDPVWFGVLFLVNMQMAMLTPPFGYGLFYMRGVAPPGVTIGDIYKSIIPFIPLQLIGLFLVLFIPQLALWLPNLVFGL
jgi:tripartite ATP-independent transporter DctM subunit